jgi:hypothetical protein
MCAQHYKLAGWLDVPATDAGVDLGRLKSALAGRGVNSRGWRIFLDFGDALFEALGDPWVQVDQPFSNGSNAVAFLKLLAACEMDVPPPPELVASMRHWAIPKHRLDDVPPHFLRAAWKACLAASYDRAKGGTSLAGYVVDKIQPVASWFFTTDVHLNQDLGLLKAGWPALDARYAEWRKARFADAAPKPDAPCDWPPFIRKVEWQGFRFVALASDAALEAEGDAMDHCIGSYGPRCRAGMLRAFSARYCKSGERAASLTVMENAPGVWSIAEINGAGNDTPPSRVEDAAFAVVRAMEDAYQLSPSTRKEMNAFRREAAAAALLSPDVLTDDILF